jgi:hypothetical protein
MAAALTHNDKPELFEGTNSLCTRNAREGRH